MQDAQNKANIIRTTVRMPAELHQQMSDEIARQSIGKRKKDQPSVDGFIQAAIGEKLSKVIPLNSNQSKVIPLGARGNPDGNTSANPDCISAAKCVDNPEAGGNLDEIKIAVPQELAPWVPKLIAVLRGPARRALEANLETFAEYTQLKEGSSGPTPGKSTEDAAKAALAALNATVKAAQNDPSRHRRGDRRGDKTA